MSLTYLRPDGVVSCALGLTEFAFDSESKRIQMAWQKSLTFDIDIP